MKFNQIHQPYLNHFLSAKTTLQYLKYSLNTTVAFDKLAFLGHLFGTISVVPVYSGMRLALQTKDGFDLYIPLHIFFHLSGTGSSK
jgi:hypothetical protein